MKIIIKLLSGIMFMLMFFMHLWSGVYIKQEDRDKHYKRAVKAIQGDLKDDKVK